MTEQQEPEEPEHPRGSDEHAEDATVDERTSPSPYAENFDEWVADEVAASDGEQPQR